MLRSDRPVNDRLGLARLRRILINIADLPALPVGPTFSFWTHSSVINPTPSQPAYDDDGNRERPRRRDDSGGETRKKPARGNTLHSRDTAPTKPAKIRPTKLRIIGGSMRGRGVLYLGDRATRPMKDSIRETVFNILGHSMKKTIAWDLFAGTGVLAIESLSRGSVHSIAIEKSGYAAKNIRNSADAIGIGSELEVITGDTFRVAPKRMQDLLASSSIASPNNEVTFDTNSPWVVFFCPPYAMWMDATDKLFELLTLTADLAPAGSQIVAETDKFFDVETLPFEGWDVRRKGNVTVSFIELSNRT